VWTDVSHRSEDRDSADAASVCVCDSQITASSIGWIHLNMATYVTLMWEYIAESDPTFNDAMSLLFFYVYYIYIYLLYLLWKAMQSVFRGFMDGQWDIGIRNPYWSSSCFAERSEAVATHTHTHTHWSIHHKRLLDTIRWRNERLWISPKLCMKYEPCKATVSYSCGLLMIKTCRKNLLHTIYL